jgi:hypothetical protein
MEKFAFYTILFFSVVGCTKYPEGPSFSIRTKENRLKGHWFVTDAQRSYRLVSGDSGQAYNENVTKEYSQNFIRWQFLEEDGKLLRKQYYGSGTSNYSTSECSFSEDKADLYIESNYQEADTLNILRLSNCELWLRKVYREGDWGGGWSSNIYEVTETIKWKSF